MKRILQVLTLIILIHAPWRVMFTVIEAMYLTPGPTRFTTDTTRYWDEMYLEARLVGMGWEVGYQKDLDILGTKVLGLTNPRTHQIWIDADLPWNARYAVLAHEGGHTLQPVWVNNDQAEAFAELVAMLVARDGIREHARYLATHKTDTFLIALIEWPAIYHAAAALEDR